MIESDEEAIERLHNFEEEFMPFVSGEAILIHFIMTYMLQEELGYM